MAIHIPLLQCIMVSIKNGSLSGDILHLSLNRTALVSINFCVGTLFLHALVVKSLGVLDYVLRARLVLLEFLAHG